MIPAFVCWSSHTSGWRGSEWIPLKKKISKQGEKILTSQMGAPCCISYYLAQKMSGFSRFIQRAETKPDSNKFSLSEFQSWRFS